MHLLSPVWSLRRASQMGWTRRPEAKGTSQFRVVFWPVLCAVGLPAVECRLKFIYYLQFQQKKPTKKVGLLHPFPIQSRLEKAIDSKSFLCLCQALHSIPNKTIFTLATVAALVLNAIGVGVALGTTLLRSAAQMGGTQ